MHNCVLIFVVWFSARCLGVQDNGQKTGLFCQLANLKDPGSAQLRPIKDTCVYLWG